MRELSEIRADLDRIDTSILGLFQERMACADEVAAYKSAHNLPILDKTRER